MKKTLKIILIILVILVSVIVFDTIQAKVFNNKPIIKFIENYNGGNLYQKHKGILVDTYVYTDGSQKTYFKWTKRTYSEQNEELEKNNAMKRYAEIRESAKKATEWYLGALYPNCSISNGTSETYTFKGSENSSWYINQGYIKRNELLDIDEKSYCDIHVKHGAYFENPLDQQRNCAVYYQIYLKCMNYEDKGYVAD